MIYREIPPHPQLRAWVHCYWELEGFAIEPQVIYPDGRPEVIFHYGDPFLRDGREQPRALFAGQLTSAETVQPTGRSGVFGVRFMPSGAWAFARFPQVEVVGAIAAIEDVYGTFGRNVAQLVFRAATSTQRVALVERELLLRAPSHADSIDLLAAAIAEGRLLSREARAESGLSERQWERTFQERTGIRPKLLERISRFRRAIQLASTGCRWAAIAAECNYADQAHMVREFREFTGGSAELSESRYVRVRSCRFYSILLRSCKRMLPLCASFLSLRRRP